MTADLFSDLLTFGHNDEDELRAAWECLRRHDALDLAEMLGLTG